MHVRKKLITGITSSGSLHLGSYLGTMKQWASYAENYESWFFIADLHAITVAQKPDVLHEKTLEMAATFLAMDLTTEHAFFIQSHVPEHTEVAWVLTCLASTGEMGRMTQFKDKSQNDTKPPTLGLYAYPCLMAADILLYDAHKVPVGEDQKQHLELTRNLAQRFNREYGEIFTVPEPLIPEVGARVMSLGDPTSKMSKSDSGTNNSIFILDPPSTIEKKIKRAVTDSEMTVEYNQSRPGISNLVQIYAALSTQSVKQVTDQFYDSGYATFKKALAEQIMAAFEPIQKRYAQLRQDEAFLLKEMARGAEKARQQAKKKKKQVFDALGLLHNVG